MKEFVGVTQEEDLYFIEQSPKGIGGRICRRKPKSMSRSVTNAKRFSLNIHQPGGVLNPLFSPWSFALWGLDIVDPFSKAAGNKRYLLVGIDYFTN